MQYIDLPAALGLPASGGRGSGAGDLGGAGGSTCSPRSHRSGKRRALPREPAAFSDLRLFQGLGGAGAPAVPGAGFEFGLGLGPDFGTAFGLGPSDAAHTISSDLCSSACCAECDQWDMSGVGDDRDDLHVEVHI